MPRLRATRNSVTGAAVAAVAAGPSYDADATTYFAAVEAADGQSLESGVKTAINDFVVGCKADGTWSALKASCILAGARTLAGALVPLVGTAPTNFNFVSADYNRKTGLIGNGSTKKLRTGRNYNQNQQNNTHFSVYADTIVRQQNKVFIGAFTEGGLGLPGGPSIVFHVHNRDFQQGYDPNTSDNSAGFIGVTRSNSSEITRRRLGQNLLISAVSATPANQNIDVFGYWGTDAFYYAGRLSFYSVGDNVDLALLDTRLTTLMAALATAVSDPDASAYIAAVEAADGQALETGVKTAITDFVIGCKLDGTWNSIKASCLLAGARTLSGALVPLVGTAPTNFNFVSGDYNRKTGLVGNGSTKYLDSNRANNADSQNSQHIGAFITNAGTSAYGTYIGAFHDGTGSSYFYRDAGGGSVLHVSRRNGSEMGTNGTILNYIGLSRASSTSYSFRMAGTTSSITATSAAPTSETLNVFRINRSSSNLYMNARMTFYSIGEAVDLALLDTRLTTLMSALATAIP